MLARKAGLMWLRHFVQTKIRKVFVHLLQSFKHGDIKTCKMVSLSLRLQQCISFDIHFKESHILLIIRSCSCAAVRRAVIGRLNGPALWCRHLVCFSVWLLNDVRAGWQSSCLFEPLPPGLPGRLSHKQSSGLPVSTAASICHNTAWKKLKQNRTGNVFFSGLYCPFSLCFLIF